MKIPSQYLPVMPYLILPDAAQFRVFAKEVFGAIEQLIVPNPDGNIMHGELKIGAAVIMFSSGNEKFKEKPAAMYLYVDDVNTVYKSALDHGALSLELPQKKEYGFSAGFADPFHNHWYIVEPDKQSY